MTILLLIKCANNFMACLTHFPALREQPVIRSQTIQFRSRAMANKEQRGNREKRKPKKDKPKPAPHVSSFSGASTKPAAGKKSPG
jgi:hypothetical protein